MATKAVKTIDYAWEGKDKRGNKAQGQVSAISTNRAKIELRKQGVTVTKIKRAPSVAAARKKKILPKDIAVFSRQLATMVDAGIPLVQGIDIVAKGHDNPSMGEMLVSIKGEVEAGTSLAESLAKFPIHFDTLFCNLVAAGEQAGVLDTLLMEIADYKEKTEAIKNKIRKAMTYPIAVMVIAFVVTAVLLIFVVPQFESLFVGFGADLPAFTQFVVRLSEGFQANWYIIFGSIFGVLYAFKEGRRRSKPFYELTDRIALKLPVVGDILVKSAYARFSRTLSTMFKAGVPMVEAMDSVAGAAGNIVFTQAILNIRDEIATGISLQAAISSTGIFPNMLIQMVAVGEESGAIDTMLAKVADFYEAEVDDAVDNLSALMEPMIMAVLGVLIGGLVIAMYMPIFKMGSVVN